MVLLDVKAVAISQHRPLALNMFAQTCGRFSSSCSLFVPWDICITCEVKGLSGAETHFKATIGYILSAESFGVLKSDGRKTRRKMQ